MKQKRIYWMMGLAFLGLALLAPGFLPRFQLRMITEVLILSLFALTWKMLLNEGGLFSFGHALYFGIGAYGSVLGWLHLPGLSLLGGILLGGLAATFAALILGTFLVRLNGTYFALLTLAFNQLVWAIVWKWRDVTGGDDGLGRFPKPDLLGISMANTHHFYYLVLLIVGLCWFLLWYYTRTPLGKIVMSIKSNEDRAQFIGFNVHTSKLIFLTMLSFFAGISGALFAQFQEFIATSTIDLGMSTNILFMAYIGGTGSFLGPIIGSGIFVYLSEYLSKFTERWEFFFGLMFIVIVLFAPQGLMGIIRKRK